jgi:hypothetical protein
LLKYRFTYPYTKFYPSIVNVEGKSLMANPGDEFPFPQGPPDDGCWVLVDDNPETPAATPEPAQEAPVPEPAPAETPATPEPSPAPVAPPEPTPVPVAPVTQGGSNATATPPFMFPGFAPFSRA